MKELGKSTQNRFIIVAFVLFLIISFIYSFISFNSSNGMTSSTMILYLLVILLLVGSGIAVYASDQRSKRNNELKSKNLFNTVENKDQIPYKVYCRICGEQIIKNDKFCPICGSEQKFI